MHVTSSSVDAETKQMIESALNRFIDDAYEPNARRLRLNRPEVDYRAHWPALVELGVLGLPVSEQFGGIGGNAQDMADALRALARGLVLEPLTECAVIAGTLLRAGVQAEVAVAELVSGESLDILVGGRKGDVLRCEAHKDGYLIHGMARVVPGAAQADTWLVACAGEDGSTRVFRLPVKALDQRIQTFRMMDGREAADIDFQACVVPGSTVWLEGADAETTLAEAAAQAISGYAADAVGVMQALVSLTTEYLRTREQFGVPLSSFQALQHRLADMHMAALEARAMARSIAGAIDAGQAQQIPWLRYAVPAVIARCSDRVGHEAIQLHGGMGVTDELIVSHYNARLVVLNQLLARWAAVPADLAPPAP